MKEKLNLKQIIAIIIMGLILICVFILRPDPYKEMDQIEQAEAQIRIQISNERRMIDHVRSIEESRRKSEEDQRRSQQDQQQDRSMELEKFIAY